MRQPNAMPMERIKPVVAGSGGLNTVNKLVRNSNLIARRHNRQPFSSFQPFSGNAYDPNTHLTSELDDSTKAWVRMKYDTYEITEEIGPPSDPSPANEVWRKKDGTFGDMYFDGVH